MSTFYFRDAELISRLALVGIAGQSRSGKTLTALRVAHGIATAIGSKVAAIDTEAGRMLEYGPGAKPFGYGFKYAQFDPPFTGERYLEILLEAEKVAGEGGVIVIDSMSHEHEGEGGVLEQHEDLVQKMGASANMTAWNRAKLGRKKLINYVRSQRKCHLIMCFRAEQKTGVRADGKPVDLGIQLIGWSGWKFEMSLFVMLNREKRGFELNHDTTAGLDQLLPDGQITEKTGEALARWCKGGNGHAAPRAADPATNGKAKTAEGWKAEATRISEAIANAADIDELEKIDLENREPMAKFPAAAQERLRAQIAARAPELIAAATDQPADHHDEFAALEDESFVPADEQEGLPL